MAKFAFVVEATISLATEVEADSLEEAIEIAKSRPPQSLCWQCSRGRDEAWTTGGELDCDPSASRLVDLHGDSDVSFEEAAEAWGES